MRNIMRQSAGSVFSIPKSPIGVLDAAACISQQSEDTFVGSPATNYESSASSKRRRICRWLFSLYICSLQVCCSPICFNGPKNMVIRTGFCRDEQSLVISHSCFHIHFWENLGEWICFDDSKENIKTEEKETIWERKCVYWFLF